MVEQPFTGKNNCMLTKTRAAEVASIECAKILLEYNADIDALNFSGQTAFHIVSFLYIIFPTRLQNDKITNSADF